MKKEFILEIGTEEMPARFVGPALEQLKELAEKSLRELRIAFEEVRSVGTPRRMAVYISGLSDSQQSLVMEVKGPALKVAYNAAGEPTPAALGFARSQGVGMADLVVKPVGPVEYVFARKSEEGRLTGQVLPEICPSLITGLHFPKPMRWGDKDFRFARPIKWLLALYGDDVVKFSLAGLESDRITYGHRFLSKGPLPVATPGDYFDRMREAFVIVDPLIRKKMILGQMSAVVESEKGRVEKDEELLDEVTNLVEYPTAFAGSFDPSYLRIPKEVLITAMREHQRYFPVTAPDGTLMPRFIAVRNGTEKHIETVRAGNEKVLRARLADAAFFWDEDLKLPLEDRVPALKKIVWQESLGTVYDKVQRVSDLSCFIGQKIPTGGDNLPLIKRSAMLAKADLVTNMVYEFTELQGIMGREYALKSGEGQEVATAIFEHYLPRFAGDDLPSSLAGRALSLADKFDTLVGCFAVGKQPTGSQDPYALRRQALGICNIILEGQLILSVREIAVEAYRGYSVNMKLKLDRDTVLEDIEEFFRQRIRGILIERGYAYDIVDAVISSGSDDLLGVYGKVEALSRFKEEPAFDAVITAYNRANNLSKKYEGTAVSPKLFQHPSEKELNDNLSQVRVAVTDRLKKRDYVEVLRQVALLREPVDKFFDSVMVMVEDEKVRDNRLALLKSVAVLAEPLAHLSKIVVAG
ncbi:MAG: glycine--tRNA ligase subunit beta [Desulfocucumaceae bacterium]